MFRKREAALDREIRSHIDEEADESGLPAVEAQFAARRAMGNRTLVMEEVREMWRWTWLERVLQDVRYGFRMTRRNPGFTAVAMVILALGIGANTAIFSVVNAVLLRPLPFHDSDRLVKIWETNPQADRWGQWAAYPDFIDWREQNRVFEDAAAMRSWVWKITGGDHPEVLRGYWVSANLFSLLGVQPMLGRAFLAGEDEPGKNLVVMLSFGVWQRRFGSDMRVVGRTVNIDGQRQTIVGVMPPHFNFPFDIAEGSTVPEMWVPFGSLERQDRGSHNVRVVARLKTGTTIAQAQANMDSVAAGIAARNPGHRGRGVSVAGLQENAIQASRPALLLLMVAIGLVLLIACANVANLQLARATARQKEAAIRQALGASRLRLVRQLLSESTIVAIASGILGLAFASWGVKVLVALAPNIPRLNETSIDPSVAAFTVLLSLATGTLFGLAPAFQGSRVDVNEALKQTSGKSTAARGGLRTRNLLIVGEVATAVIVLIGAALVVRSYLLLQKVELGFNPNNLLTAYLASGAKDASGHLAFFTEVLDRIEGLPGVEAAGGASAVPLRMNDNGPFRVEGQPAPQPNEPAVYAERPRITPGYLRAMSIQRLRGREFTWGDRADSLPVAIVSEAVARRYWPDDDPIGKRVSIEERNGEPVWRTIVGLAGDTKHDGLMDELRPAIYVPFAQAPRSLLVLAVRTRTDPKALVAPVRRAVMAVQPDQPLFAVETMENVVSAALSRPRFQALLLAVFGAMALILAAAGIYGVISYTVSQRTHEIAVRVSLGAPRGQVLSLVMRQGLALTLAGVAIGIGASLALTRLLAKLLFAVRPTDPATFVAIPAVLIAVAMAACYLPARRASSVDPLIALRSE